MHTGQPYDPCSPMLPQCHCHARAALSICWCALFPCANAAAHVCVQLRSLPCVLLEFMELFTTTVATGLMLDALPRQTMRKARRRGQEEAGGITFAPSWRQLVEAGRAIVAVVPSWLCWWHRP